MGYLVNSVFKILQYNSMVVIEIALTCAFMYIDQQQHF